MRSALGVHGIDLRGSVIWHADMLAGSAFCVLATRRKNRGCLRPSDPNRGRRAFPPRLREVARALAAQSAGARIPTLRYQRGLATAVVLFTAPPCLGRCVFLSARRKRLLDRRRFCDRSSRALGYVGTPPRTLAWLCAHELTHIVTAEQVGLRRFFVPEWVWEGFADYVGIENRQSFEELRDALGDHPIDVPMMQRYGSYPRYRLLVTYFIEKKGWTASQLLETRITTDEAVEIMRADRR
jgi:hypothetical protein